MKRLLWLARRRFGAFEIGLVETARAFTNLESLVIARHSQLERGETDFELVRLSLTQINADECARVLSIRPQDKEKMANAEREILEAFDKRHQRKCKSAAGNSG